MMFDSLILKKRIRGFVSRNDKKIIFFINITRGLNEIIAVLNDCLKDYRDNILLLFFNMEIPACADGLKFEKCLSEDYLSIQDYEDIDNYVFRSITKNWYLLKELGPVLEYDGVELGNLVDYEFKQFLVYRIKNLEVVKKAVKQHSPPKIIGLEDTGELNEAVALIGKRWGVPTLTFSCRRTLKWFLGCLVRKLKSGFSDIFSIAIDYYMRRRVMRDGNVKKSILMDTKMLNMLTIPNRKNCLIQLPIEKGLKIRFRAIRNYGGYFPFHFFFFPHGDLKVRFKDFWKNLESNLSFRASFHYKDIDYWEIVKAKLAYFVTISFPRIVKNVELLKKVAKKKDIRLILLRSDARELEKTIAVTANKLNISTFSMQHGVLAEINGAVSIICDRLAVWGRASVEWYRDLGEEADKCVITGNPKFDVLCGRNKNKLTADNTRAMFDRLKPDSKRIVLFTAVHQAMLSSYYTYDRGIVLMRKILEAIRIIDNTYLVIKVHPYDNNSDIYRRIIKDSKVKNVVLLKKENIYDLIRLSQVVIVHDSTAGLEAILLDKPVISINLTRRRDLIPYVRYGVALGVHTPQDISTVINDVLDNPQIREKLRQARKEFIDKYAYSLDGMAGKRIGDLIEEMTEMRYGYR